MNQEEHKNDKRPNPFSSFKRTKENGGNGPVPKGPKFSFYWIWPSITLQGSQYGHYKSSIQDDAVSTTL